MSSRKQICDLGPTDLRSTPVWEFALDDVPLTLGPLRGEIDGFLVLEDWRTGRTRVLR